MKSIVLTGASGFIASCLLRKLNDEGISDLLLVDDFTRADKLRNLDDKSFRSKIHRSEFLPWLEKNASQVSFIFHLGARTDTTEKSTAIFDDLNLHYSQAIWSICTEQQIPLVYASSAATYGAGELGYEDRHDLPPLLQPLNPYGKSKNDFDTWALWQTVSDSRREMIVSEKIFSKFFPKQSSLSEGFSPPFWAGLKFFNVFGANEYHKGRMASVIFHTVQQIRQTGGMKLFRSHRPDLADGWQMRDFIYVKDVVEVCWFFYKNQQMSGLYNVGTGKARTFLDLVTCTFRAMNLETNISFIDMPQDIRDTYQYFTEAKMEKLRAAGFERAFRSLEEGVEDYVKYYLLPGTYF